jgi:hypothetical protein
LLPGARVSPLHIETLAFPESELLKWKQGDYEMLVQSQASPFIKQILVEKLRRRSRRSRRFFGEAFVAASVQHEKGWYGSFKWLTSRTEGRDGHAFGYAGQYRAALRDHFPSALELPLKAAALCELLEGKKPVPPDLWLIVNGEHRFIEVKLPGDRIRDTQIAGLALIASCLSTDSDVSAWVFNLHPQDGPANAIPAGVEEMYQKFCRVCKRPNAFAAVGVP